MKIDAQKPNILRLAYHQEERDHNYGSCLWAYFDFDLDRYMLNIQSDCGNAAYRWCETPEHESFLHLMARMNDDYLMNKLFTDDVVDVNATLDEVREWLGIGDEEALQQPDLTDEEREEREEALEELDSLLEDCDSPGHAERILEDWNDCHDFDLDCVCGRVVTDYTAQQKRIVRIFHDHIQPKIREMIRSGEKDGG